MGRIGATLLSAAVMAVVALATPASAATYLFTFQNDSASANFGEYGDVLIDGTFTTAANLPSQITAISGTVSGGSVLDGTITGLSSYAGADNTLYGIGSFGNYSFSGVSFTVQSGANTADYNLYDWNGSTFLLSSGVDSTGYPQNGTDAQSITTPTPNLVTPVPEPATWAMLLLGFFGIGFTMRGARRKDALTIA